MVAKSWSNAASILVLLLAASATATAQQPTFRSNVNLINVTFSARTPQGLALSDLKQEEVQVFEDDVLQAIRFFDNATLPLTVGLIVDASNSQEKFFRNHRRDLEKFLKDALDPQDEAFLICFGNHIRLVSDFTPSGNDIMEAYARYDHGDSKFPELGPKEDRSEGGTALFDAIYDAVTEKLQGARPGRHALIVFSDGEDNSSARDVMEAIEAAQGTDVLVFCVRYIEERRSPTARDKYGMRTMTRIAHDTGADDFDAVKGADLETTFKQIGAELRTLYTVGYYANQRRRDDTFRRVTVRVSRPDAMIRAKTGYYAKP